MEPPSTVKVFDLKTLSLLKLTKNLTLKLVLEKCKKDPNLIDSCENNAQFWRRKLELTYGNITVAQREDLISGLDWYEYVQGLVNNKIYGYYVFDVDINDDRREIRLVNQSGNNTEQAKIDEIKKLYPNHSTLGYFNIKGLPLLRQNSIYWVTISFNFSSHNPNLKFQRKIGGAKEQNRYHQTFFMQKRLAINWVNESIINQITYVRETLNSFNTDFTFGAILDEHFRRLQLDIPAAFNIPPTNHRQTFLENITQVINNNRDATISTELLSSDMTVRVFIKIIDID